MENKIARARARYEQEQKARLDAMNRQDSERERERERKKERKKEGKKEERKVQTAPEQGSFKMQMAWGRTALDDGEFAADLLRKGMKGVNSKIFLSEVPVPKQEDANLE